MRAKGPKIELTINMDDGSPRPRVLFLGNHPWAHPSHQDLATRVGATVGIAMAPHHGLHPFRGLVHGWRLAKATNWDALLAEGPCSEVFTLRVFDKRRRRLVRLDSMSAARRSARGGDRRGPTRWIRVLELRQWDALVVFNREHEEAVQSLAGKRPATAFWTPAVTVGDPFGRVVSRQSGPAIALITGERLYRVKYKGLDRVALLSRHIQGMGMDPVTVYGAWPEAIERRFSDTVRFEGHKPTSEALTGAGCLVHLSRLDSFPLAPIEAMVAGVPPVIARGGAGCAPIVDEVEPRLVVSTVDEAADTVRWLGSLPSGEYSGLCGRLRQRGLQYVEVAATEAHVADVRRALTSPGSP